VREVTELAEHRDVTGCALEDGFDLGGQASGVLELTEAATHEASGGAGAALAARLEELGQGDLLTREVLALSE
jgi:hypothetical protein